MLSDNTAATFGLTSERGCCVALLFGSCPIQYCFDTVLLEATAGCLFVVCVFLTQQPRHIKAGAAVCVSAPADQDFSGFFASRQYQSMSSKAMSARYGSGLIVIPS